MVRKILILLLSIISFSGFTQTNATFKNLDIRNKSHLRGAVDIDTTLHLHGLKQQIIAMNSQYMLILDSATENVYHLRLLDFIDSVGVYADTGFWDKSGNYLFPKTITDSVGIGNNSPDAILDVRGAFQAIYDSTFIGYKKVGGTLGLISMYIQSGDSVSGLFIERTDDSFSASISAAGTAGYSELTTNASESIFVQMEATATNANQFIRIDDDSSYIWLYSSDEISDTTYVYIKPGGITINTDTVKINGTLKVDGDLTYEYIHLVAYTTGGSYTPNTVSNTEFKLAPTFTTAENDGLTFAGDTVTIIEPGDYMVSFMTVFQAANGDDWVFKCRKNGTAITSGNLALSSTGAGNYISGSWMWYLVGLAVGDDISFSVTNEGSSNDPTFRSIKIFIEKKPE